MTIALVDYGIGNIQSVANAFARLGAECRIVASGDDLLAAEASAIIMPGVGAVGEALRLLRDRGIDAALEARVIQDKIPFLGICVGMQVMAETCKEFGVHQGFGWIPGTVGRMDEDRPDLRLPHVGWNDISATSGGVLEPFDGQHFYFVHSYAFDCAPEHVLATANYGGPFVAAVQRGHIRGVQFHPEKSSGAGEALLAACIAETREAKVA